MSTSISRFAALALCLAIPLSGCNGAVDLAADDHEDVGTANQADTSYPFYSDLCVYAQHNSDGGTSNEVALLGYFEGSTTYYSCSVPYVPSGVTMCCAPTAYVSPVPATSNSLVVYNTGSDGLRLSSITAIKLTAPGQVSRTDIGDFYAGNYAGNCSGCSGNKCGSCWVDQGGNGGCGEAKIDLDSSHITCAE